MRLAWAHLRPNAWEQYEERFQSLNRPIAGLTNRWLVRDTKDPDALYTVQLWETAQAIADWEKSDFYKDVYAPAFRALVVGESSISVCEVRVASGDLKTPV